MNSAEGITEDNISSVQRDELARLTEQHRMYRARKERELAETREQHQDELIGTGILAAVGGALLAVGAFALSSIIKTSKKPSGDKR
jgi:isochorismate hydrolase